MLKKYPLIVYALGKKENREAMDLLTSVTWERFSSHQQLDSELKKAVHLKRRKDNEQSGTKQGDFTD